jgi:phage host-nuclease inhibitor protein Gam
MEWIDEALSEGVIPEEIPAEPAPASDLEEVNRLMRRLRHVERQIGDVNDQHAAETRALARWRSEQLNRLNTVRDFIERALDGWARAEYGVTFTKTHKLPYGTLSLRGKRATVDVSDEAAATAFLVKRGFPGLVRLNPEVAKNAIQHFMDGVLADDDSGITTLTRGPVDNVAPVEGMEQRAIFIRTEDHETGAIEQVAIPGVRLSEAVDGVRGLNFTIKLRDPEGEET